MASEEMARSLSSEGESTFDAEIVGVERYEVTTRTLQPWPRINPPGPRTARSRSSRRARPLAGPSSRAQ